MPRFADDTLTRSAIRLGNAASCCFAPANRLIPAGRANAAAALERGAGAACASSAGETGDDVSRRCR
ncbi:hypothetical protein C6Q14_16155 [Burkholderia ambifaria]|nr:hypothetical protein C6Q14_16155 [Burkholderia ambifaria]